MDSVYFPYYYSESEQNRGIFLINHPPTQPPIRTIRRCCRAIAGTRGEIARKRRTLNRLEFYGRNQVKNYRAEIYQN